MKQALIGANRMHLRRKEKLIVVGVVTYVLDRLFETVNHDREAMKNLKWSLNLQDSQIAAWKAGRNLPNMSTLYRLALRAGVLHEITAALQEVDGLDDLPPLVPEDTKTS